MYKVEQAELKDVDLILDFKLDIIFSSDEIASLEKNELEKIVNYCEEEIRENIEEYKLVYENDKLVAMYAVGNMKNGKIIDTMYVVQNYRRMGIGTYILNNIINNSYQSLYLWIYKNNKIAIDFYKKYNFEISEETEYKYFMKCDNKKIQNDDIKLKTFEQEVKLLAEKYGIEYTIKSKIKK